MKKLALLTSLIFATVSCENTKKEPLKIVALDQMDSSQAQASLRATDFAELVATIALDYPDSCSMKSFELMAESATNYYGVADGEIVIFDGNGKFIRTIADDQYLNVSKMLIHDNHLYVMDYLGQKMVKFGLDGSFRSTWAMPEGSSFDSFAIVGEQIIYTAVCNAVNPEIYTCDLDGKNGKMVSTPERTSQSEGLIGETYIFGDKGQPLIYHYFNDTVFSYVNQQLLPAYLLKTGKHTYQFDELDMSNQKRADGFRIQIKDVVKIGGYTFVTYNNSMAMYSDDFKIFHPNITLENAQNSQLSITGDMIVGHNPQTLIMVKSVDDLNGTDIALPQVERGKYVIVKYKMK